MTFISIKGACQLLTSTVSTQHMDNGTMSILKQTAAAPTYCSQKCLPKLAYRALQVCKSNPIQMMLASICWKTYPRRFSDVLNMKCNLWSAHPLSSFMAEIRADAVRSSKCTNASVGLGSVVKGLLWGHCLNDHLFLCSHPPAHLFPITSLANPHCSAVPILLWSAPI